MIEQRKPKFFYGYIIVSVAFIIMVVAIGGLNSFGVFFEPVLVEFDWMRAMTSGAFSLSAVIYGLLSITAGRLNDRFGPRLLLIASGIFMGLGYFLMSQILKYRTCCKRRIRRFCFQEFESWHCFFFVLFLKC